MRDLSLAIRSAGIIIAETGLRGALVPRLLPLPLLLVLVVTKVPTLDEAFYFTLMKPYEEIFRLQYEL